EGAGVVRDPADDVRGGAPAESERHDSAAGDKQALSHGGPFPPRLLRLPRGTAACIGLYDYFSAPTVPVLRTTASSSRAAPKRTGSSAVRPVSSSAAATASRASSADRSRVFRAMHATFAGRPGSEARSCSSTSSVNGGMGGSG